MRIRYLLSTLALLSLIPAAGATAQEKAIKHSELPAAVQRAVDAGSTDAVIKGFTREAENGGTFYEAEMTVNGRNRDVLMDQQGNVVEVEEEMALDSLPAAVRSALQERAQGGTIERVESLSRHGCLVAYEAVVKTGAKRREIQVGPRGERLDREE